MPRLLLVDDNPSIHKIAETLLASSDVELVSCGSGAQAMALVDRGDRFDVALLDTSMLEMDGWTLLQRLRDTDATRRMPVAMMAGVLDVVDPERVRRAPIQGFLKKPIELRDLADRVRRLLESPVILPEPPAPPPAAEAQADLLLLEPRDLQEEPPAARELPGDLGEILELEELDLESLRSLPMAAPPAEPEPAVAALDDATVDLIPMTVPEFLLSDALPDLPALAGAESPVTSGDLPDLAAEPDQLLRPGPALVDADAGRGAAQPMDWSDESDTLVSLAAGVPAAPGPMAATPPAPFPDGITLTDLLDSGPPPLAGAGAEAAHAIRTGSWQPGDELWTAAGPAAPSAPAQPEGPAPAPLAALLEDPALMDRLARAVVARLGDQALREIAWEIMPDLAERLRRKDTP
jgi:CheY-like chemotaxis protein